MALARAVSESFSRSSLTSSYCQGQSVRLTCCERTADPSWVFDCREFRLDPVDHIKDIFIQEVMKISGGRFENDDIDMNSITFEGDMKKRVCHPKFFSHPHLTLASKVQEPIEFFKPEPYQGQRPSAAENKTMWQTLMDRSAAKKRIQEIHALSASTLSPTTSPVLTNHNGFANNADGPTSFVRVTQGANLIHSPSQKPILVSTPMSNIQPFEARLVPSSQDNPSIKFESPRPPVPRWPGPSTAVPQSKLDKTRI